MGVQMESPRTRRVGELIQAELSEIILRELKDPRIGFVTITGVDVTPDLRHADVFISVLGSKRDRDASLAALQNSAGFLRKELASRIEMKYFPDLKFKIDPSIEAGMKIDKIIRKLHANDDKSNNVNKNNDDTIDNGDRE
jgi:ribosome-binding factor A